jgi:hypothetical protein
MDLLVNHLQHESDYRVHVLDYLAPFGLVDSFDLEGVPVLLFDAVIEGMVLADLLEDVESEMVDYVL